MTIARYTATDLPAAVDRINKYTSGMDETFDRLFKARNIIELSAIQPNSGQQYGIQA